MQSNDTRTVLVQFTVEVAASDTRTVDEITEAVLAEYGHRGGDESLYVEPVKKPAFGSDPSGFTRV